MRRPVTLGKMLVLGAILAVAAPAHARTVRLHVDSVRTGVGSLAGVDASLSWADGSDRGELEMRVRQLDFPLLSYRARDIAWRCTLQRDGEGQWDCAGRVQVGKSRGHPLSLSISPAATRADLAIGDSRISYAAQAASPDLSRIELERIPVAWLEAYLAGLWAAGQWTHGTLGGRIDVIAPSAAPFLVRTDLRLADVGLETPDGWLAAADVDGTLALEYSEHNRDTRVQATLTTTGGEFLAGSFYARLPATPVRIDVTARQRGDGPWSLPAFAWADGQVVRAQGSAGLDAEADIRELEVELDIGDLAIARDRYLSGFLAPAGFADLMLAGRADATLRLAAGELQEMSLQLAGVSAIDPRERFTMAGVHGDLRWTASATAVASGLGWTSGALYGIGLGKADFRFSSVDGELRLREASAVEVLDGRLSLDDLRWQPPTAEHGARFQFGATLTGLDLAVLSQRLDWPPFTGSLGGRIPTARYENGILALDGDLTMQLFGGSVALSRLVMERPFGVAPTLSADIAIEDLDMEPLTAAFGFGSITGRLDGRIAGLRMVDWTPVAFDARLQTDPAWKGRRRISQRAVEDISRVGGAGLVAGLQTQVLRLFDEFRYARIGLACRLRDNVCTMDGVGSAGDGYTIVEGAGLPRIQVVGFRRKVDWPTLLARLRAATEGQAPVIQ